LSATFFQVMQRLQETVQVAEDQRLSFVSSSATGYLTQETVILSDGIPFDVFDGPAYSNALQNSRGFLSSYLTSFGGELSPCLTELSKVIGNVSATGAPQTNPTQIFPVLYLFMAKNLGSFETPPLVNSRNLTRGTPSYGGSNVGNGLLKRLNVDQYGYPLEGGFAETLTMLCGSDNQGGANGAVLIGQEQFSVQGQPFRDALTWYSTNYGSGLNLAVGSGLNGVTGNDTQALIQNPSFASSSGTSFTSSFALTGWTQTSGLAASMGLDTTNYYRACSIENPPAALEATASVTITQTLASNNGSLANFAYLSQLAVDFSIHSGTGSVTVQIGSKSWTVSSGVSGWNLLLPTLDKNLWFQNFNVAALAVTITITVTGGTGINVDDFCWKAFTNVGGALYWLIGGSTAWLVGDTITVVDSEPSPPSKVQNWIRLMFPGYFLPSAVLPAAPTVPTLALVAAGSMTVGVHSVATTNNNGTNESAPSPVAKALTTGANLEITVTPATGPGGTTKRGVYVTTVTDPNTLYFVGYIANNTPGATLNITGADGTYTAQAGSYGDPAN
jgi:hypothetical protein